MSFKNFCLYGAVKIQHTLNPDHKVFYTRGKLADYYYDHHCDINKPLNVPILTQAIYEGIKKIRGVNKVVIYQYTIHVYVDPSLWETILPQIKRVFASYLQWKTEIE